MILSVSDDRLVECKSLLAPILAPKNKKPCKLIIYRVLSGVGGTTYLY